MNRAKLSKRVRILCAILGGLGLGMAWRLTVLGGSGAEDVPPPFTLIAGIGGFVLLGAGLLGRVPRRDARRPERSGVPDA